MKNSLFQTCLILTLLGLLLITPIGKASATTEWNLKITNLTGTTTTYSYDQLLAMPTTEVSATLLCYGNLVTYGLWSGISLNYLLQQVGADPSVASIDFTASDGYTASIPIQVATQSNVIIAYEKDGSPLSEKLRLVLPGENGAMWIALITSITLSTVVINANVYASSATAGQSQLPPMNSIGQSTTQQLNTTQPNQKISQQQSSSPASASFPVGVIYGIALGVTIALVAASYLVYSRRRMEK
jgi:DMSO/TMAO reductase YedYZ molybdopterin-dependent catalytic subunit